jgi:hypothetical protein
VPSRPTSPSEGVAGRSSVAPNGPTGGGRHPRRPSPSAYGPNTGRVASESHTRGDSADRPYPPTHREHTVPIIILLVVLALIFGGIGLLVEGLFWLLIISVILFVVGGVLGTRGRGARR